MYPKSELRITKRNQTVITKTTRLQTVIIIQALQTYIDNKKQQKLNNIYSAFGPEAEEIKQTLEKALSQNQTTW